jgi:hypothetical protein
VFYAHDVVGAVGERTLSVAPVGGNAPRQAVISDHDRATITSVEGPRVTLTQEIGMPYTTAWLKSRVPRHIRRRVRLLIAPAKRNVPGRRPDWGNLRRAEPFSASSGWDEE